VLKRPANPPVIEPHCADTVVTTGADVVLAAANFTLVYLALADDSEAGPAVAVFAIVPAALGVLASLSAVHGLSVRGDCKKARDSWNARPRS